MSASQINDDGSITMLKEDLTLGDIETRIKTSLLFESSCTKDVLASVSNKQPAIITLEDTI